jgi:hypothetical protein
MAKISANGATKIASASKVEATDHGRVKTRYTLRSDGKILRAVDVEGPYGWNQFRAYCARHNLTEA